MASHRRAKESSVMNFDEAITYILEYEGGYSDHPDDPGSKTKYGVSQRAYPKINIKDLTVEQAKNIYKLDYWDLCGAELLPPALRLMVLDCAVLQGIQTSIKFTQRCVGVKSDGHIGPVTKLALNNINQIDFLIVYSKLRLERFSSLPHWGTFGVGWTKRLLDVTLNCVRFL